MTQELLNAFKEDDLHLFLRLKNNSSIFETQIDAENPQMQANEYLHFAAEYNSVEIAKNILDENDTEDIDIKNNDNKTPLEIAASHKQKQLVILLVFSGANVDELQPSEQKEVLKILVEHTMPLFAKKTGTTELPNIITSMAKIRNCKKVDLLNLMAKNTQLKKNRPFYCIAASLTTVFLAAMAVLGAENKIDKEGNFFKTSVALSSCMFIVILLFAIKDSYYYITSMHDLLESTGEFSNITQKLIDEGASINSWNVSENDENTDNIVSGTLIDIDNKGVALASPNIGSVFSAGIIGSVGDFSSRF